MKIETTFDRARRYYTKEQSIIKNPLQTKIITKEEHQQFMSLMDPMCPNRLIFELMWDTGCRPIEACSCQVENFNKDFTEWGYKIGKGKRIMRDGKLYVISNARIVPISKELSKKLQLYTQISFLPYGFLFGSNSNYRINHNPRSLNALMDKIRKKLGGRWLEKDHFNNSLISPYSYRRSWITRFVEQNPDYTPFEVAKAIGHKSPDTTYGYFQFTERQQENVRRFIESNS